MTPYNITEEFVSSREPARLQNAPALWCALDGKEKCMAGLQVVSLDKILIDRRDQPEKVAEEMIKLSHS